MDSNAPFGVRQIATHRCPGNVNDDSIALYAIGERGPCGANAEYGYTVEGADPCDQFAGGVGFQRGPIAESGPNGITNETLLAIVIDRLEGRQAGSHPYSENGIALTKIQEALMWLHRRTQRRLAAKTEGTNAPD